MFSRRQVWLDLVCMARFCQHSVSEFDFLRDLIDA